MQNDTDNALVNFIQASNLSSSNEKYQANIAEIHYARKDYKNAVYWYNSTLSLDKNDLIPYFFYSNSYRCLGDLENARKIQEQQIKLMEDNSTKDQPINKRPISFYFKTKLGDKVKLDNNQKIYYAYYNTALTHYLLGNETKTLEYLNKAKDLQLDPDSESKVKKY